MRRSMQRQWVGERRGAMLVFVTLSMTGLCLFFGMVMDMGRVYHERRLEQKAADAAAIAGASEIYRGASTDTVKNRARAGATTHGYTNGTAGVTVTANHPPISGAFVGDVRFVEVRIDRPLNTFFARLLGYVTWPASARAVAGIGAPGRSCLYALDPSAEKSLEIQSNSHIVAGCGVVVNSTSSKALSVTSAGTLTATGGVIAVTGGAEGGGWTPAPTTGVPAEPNPLSYLPRPSTVDAPCNYTKVKVDASGTTTLNPGVYCGDGGYALEIGGSNTNVVLNPGMYTLRGGGLKASGSTTTIRGAGICIVNTNAPLSQGGADKFGKIDIGSGISITLSAMTTGPLAGILFYQDPLAGKPGDVYENIISSGSTMNLTGTLYFPTQSLILAHSGSAANINGGVVARTVDVTSGSRVNFTNPPRESTPFKRISLVE